MLRRTDDRGRKSSLPMLSKERRWRESWRGAIDERIPEGRARASPYVSSWSSFQSALRQRPSDCRLRRLTLTSSASLTKQVHQVVKQTQNVTHGRACHARSL